MTRSSILGSFHSGDFFCYTKGGDEMVQSGTLNLGGIRGLSESCRVGPAHFLSLRDIEPMVLDEVLERVCGIYC
jgi:hypothetical protein